jgi:hypothetical protein
VGAVVDRPGDQGADPFISAADVIGLHRPDVAATATPRTACSTSDNTHDVPND